MLHHPECEVDAEAHSARLFEKHEEPALSLSGSRAPAPRPQTFSEKRSDTERINGANGRAFKLKSPHIVVHNRGQHCVSACHRNRHHTLRNRLGPRSHRVSQYNTRRCNLSRWAPHAELVDSHPNQRRPHIGSTVAAIPRRRHSFSSDRRVRAISDRTRCFRLAATQQRRDADVPHGCFSGSGEDLGFDPFFCSVVSPPS